MPEETRKQLLQTEGRIHSFDTFGSVDGPGIRFVFFLQGCPLRCLYCHNPDSIPISGGEIWTAERALNEVIKYKGFIKNGGVTFSGGEPLLQTDFIEALTTLLSEKNIHVAIDTSGFIPLQKSDKAIDLADLILLDIKALDDEISVPLTGASSANSFKTLDYCEETQKKVWVRHVLLAGYTLDLAHAESLAKKLSTYSCIEKIELLPFHKMGEDKWEMLGKEYTLHDTPATTKAETMIFHEIFKKFGFDVQ